LKRSDYYIAGLCLAGILPHLLYALSGQGFFLAHTVTDDTFYYLKIAENAWARGLWFSFDGINPTNGFHPLYGLLLIALYPFTEGGFAFVRGAVVLCGVFHVAAGLLLYRLMRRYAGTRGALLAAGLWLFHPWPVRMSIYGMETPLSVALVLALLCWLESIERRETGPAWRDGAVLGILAGLGFLARLELGLLAGTATGAWLVWRTLRAAGRRWTCLAAYTACTVAVVIPFLAHNYISMGHVGTISSATKLSASLAEIRDKAGRVETGRFVTRGLKNAVRNTAMFGTQFISGAVSPGLTAATGAYPSVGRYMAMGPRAAVAAILQTGAVAMGIWLAVLAAAFAGAAAIWRKARPEPYDGGTWAGVIIFFVTTAGHLALNSFVVGAHTGGWYWGVEAAALAAACGLAVRLPRVGPYAGAAGTALVMAGVAFYGALLMPWDGVPLPAQRNYGKESWLGNAHEAAAWMRDNLPREAVVASFNAGALGYFSERTVINIDGLVNDFRFFEYRVNKRIGDYLRESGVTHFSDSEAVMTPAQQHADIGLPDAVFTLLHETRPGGSFVEAVRFGQ